MSEGAWGLGATLYMPAVNRHAAAVLRAEPGAQAWGAGSVVICLEDALSDADVGCALDVLRAALPLRAARLGDLAPGQRPRTMVFVRPRDLAMAQRIADLPGAGSLDGFIIPKMTAGNARNWLAFAHGRAARIMPTLEGAEFFDPAGVGAIRDIFDAEGRGAILAVRIGGNDLLRCLGLRRTRGRTSHEGPLAWPLGLIATGLMAHGYPVTAPVYDVIDDLDTLAREVARDVELGFVGKTAIHPAQVPVIHAALKVDPTDLHLARAILDDGAAAVFQIGGMMCEPATHRAWAGRIIAAAARWGLREPGPATAVQPRRGRTARRRAG